MKLNEYIDHTLLKADANKDDITKLCLEAKDNQFKAICINPYWLSYANSLLKDSNVSLCTVIGFPLGANEESIKVNEALLAIEKGANELDFVMNISAFKSKNYEDASLKKSIASIKELHPNIITKIIIETSLLDNEEIIKACQLALEAKADFVKTSTGFSTGGAKVEDIKLMKSVVKDQMLIKASGGIKDKETALLMIEAGANRIGTSNGVQIVSK